MHLLENGSDEAPRPIMFIRRYLREKCILATTDQFSYYYKDHINKNNFNNGEEILIDVFTQDVFSCVEWVFL